MRKPTSITFANGGAPSVTVEIDRDEAEEWIVVAHLYASSHPDAPNAEAPRAALQIAPPPDPGAASALEFRLKDGRLTRKIDAIGGREPIDLVVRRDRLADVARDPQGFIHAGGIVSRSYPNDPAQGRRPEMRITAQIKLFHRRLDPPDVQIAFASRIDLDGENELRERIPLARVSVAFDPNVADYKGPPRALTIAARLSDPYSKDLPPSLDMIEAPEKKESVWRETPDLSFDSHTAFRVVDIALPLGEARRLLRRADAPSGHVRSLPLKLKVTSVFQAQDRPVKTEKTDDLPLSGTIRETATIDYAGRERVIALADEGQKATLLDSGKPVMAVWRGPNAPQGKRISVGQRFTKLTFTFDDGPHAAPPSFRASLLRAVDERPAVADVIPCGVKTVPSPKRLPTDRRLPPYEVAVPIDELIKSLVAQPGEPWGDWICRLDGEAKRPNESGPSTLQTLTLDIPVRLGKGAVGWAIAVDFGASATAIRIEPMNVDLREAGFDLRLGRWFERIDKRHDESKAMTGGKESETSGLLLPSHVGLAAAMNARDRFDPLSLPAGARLGTDPDASDSRRRALERTYDVSVPFPSSERLPDYMDDVVFALKTALRETDGPIDPAELMGDYFAELGDYVVPNALAMQAGKDPRAQRFRKAWIDGLDDPTLILTHPSGVEKKRIHIYRNSGERFLKAIGCGGRGRIALVPEAVAAARYGVEDFLLADRDAAGRHLFIALDIGAGTYDVTAFSAEIKSGRASGWRSEAHFGLPVGGAALDQAFAACVAGVLKTAAGARTLADAFLFADRLPSSIEDLRRLSKDRIERLAGVNFLKELRLARARLTDALLSSSAPDYSWTSAGPPISLCVGEEFARGAEKLNWPVAPLSRNLLNGTVWSVDEMGASLAFERGEDGCRVALRIGPETFAADPELSKWIELMGEVLPAMAARAAKTDASMQGPIWIVTGRAALWPPLFERIAATVKAVGGRLARSKPFEAHRMKRAVVDGALRIAADEAAGLEIPDLDLSAPLAIMAMDRNAPAHVAYVPGSNASHGEARMTLDAAFEGECRLGRAAPGLDDARLSYFRKAFPDLRKARPWKMQADSFHCDPNEPFQIVWRRASDGDVYVSFKNGNSEMGPFLQDGSLT